MSRKKKKLSVEDRMELSQMRAHVLRVEQMYKEGIISSCEQFIEYHKMDERLYQLEVKYGLR